MEKWWAATKTGPTLAGQALFKWLFSLKSHLNVAQPSTPAVKSAFSLSPTCVSTPKFPDPLRRRQVCARRRGACLISKTENQVWKNAATSFEHTLQPARHFNPEISPGYSAFTSYLLELPTKSGQYFHKNKNIKYIKKNTFTKKTLDSCHYRSSSSVCQ